jgi:hypothetical protein
MWAWVLLVDGIVKYSATKKIIQFMFKYLLTVVTESFELVP